MYRQMCKVTLRRLAGKLGMKRINVDDSDGDANEEASDDVGEADAFRPSPSTPTVPTVLPELSPARPEFDVNKDALRLVGNTTRHKSHFTCS
jgi:hypothetical protein